MKTLDEIREAVFQLCHPIFRECCDPDCPRLSLSAPFLWRGGRDAWVIATDGRIMVFEEAMPKLVMMLADCEPRRVPDVGYLITSRQKYRSVVCHIPELPAPVSCPKCKGRGGECKNCQGIGSGIDPYASLRLYPGFTIGVHYAEMLKRHNAVVLLPKGLSKSVAIRFELDGGAAGYLMQFVKGEEKDDLE